MPGQHCIFHAKHLLALPFEDNWIDENLTQQGHAKNVQSRCESLPQVVDTSLIRGRDLSSYVL